MNGRILVLFGAIGLFIAAWSGGRQHPAATVRLAERQVIARQTMALSVVKSESRQRTINWEGVAPAVEVPQALDAGRYRVVSDQGEVGFLVVTGESTSDPAPSLAIQTAGPVRWYFIRLQTTPSLALQKAESKVFNPHPIAVAAESATSGQQQGGSVTAWNSKERDIQLARLRNWFNGANELLHVWKSPAVFSVGGRAPVVPVQTKPLDPSELGDIPEFQTTLELSELPELTKLPKLTEEQLFFGGTK